MAMNRLLLPKTMQDIDARVERVLKGLGNPEPPIQLVQVRELLKLDIGYYTADDPGLVREVISRIRVAGMQVFQRPTLLLDAISKMSLKALYVPDGKRILLDKALPPLKHRWNEAHEVGHSLLPWHDDAMLGDNSHTLSRDCHEQVEAEANFAAGRLLFLRDKFGDEARDHAASIATVRALNKRFGNTISTTLYRFVEATGTTLPLIGMITEGHPHISKRPATFVPGRPCKHFIRSPAFAQRFARVDERVVFEAVTAYSGPQKAGPLGQSELLLMDDNGDQHTFVFETFFNRYDALTLGVYIRPYFRAVAV